jgi:hypothetical protein
MQTQVPDEKTLREFEAFLRERHPSCNVPRYFLILVVEYLDCVTCESAFPCSPIFPSSWFLINWERSRQDWSTFIARGSFTATSARKPSVAPLKV